MPKQVRYSDAQLIVEYEEGTVEETEEVWQQFEDIMETFKQHLTDRLNAKLPGKWSVHE